MVTQAGRTAESVPLTDLPDGGGHFGPYGGRFVAETLMGPLEELRLAYEKYCGDPDFQAELDTDLARFVGRPHDGIMPTAADCLGAGRGRQITRDGSHN